MSKGFVQSGKLGPISGTRGLGQAIPIVNASMSPSAGCPAGYSRNDLGVCILGPQIVGGSSVIYTTPFILGRGRR